MGILFCVAGFTVSFGLGRRSIVAGLGSVLTAGYFYGILRANYLDTYSYFLFDCAVVGFYLSFLGERPAAASNPVIRQLQVWLTILIGWAVVMFLMPIQHPMIQIVGLRGNAFLLPFVLVGSGLQRRDYECLAIWLSLLNLVALGFAAAEFLMGVEPFFPLNAATQLIYNSNDVAGHTALRIPATFSNAHNYAGTMLSTLPWLVGALVQPGRPVWLRGLLAFGILAALLGMFLTATRMGVVVLFILVVVATFSGELKGGVRIGWIVLLALVGYVVSSEERMQRFLTLQNTDVVLERIEGSVNLGFLELLVRYPMGNGMGAGGTSVPYFLRHLLTDPVMIENEYGRILLEQGLVGLCLWAAFIVWLLTRPAPPPGASWRLGWRLLWYACAIQFVLATLGTGLLTAIPQTALFLTGVGMVAAYRGDPAVRRHRSKKARAVTQSDEPAAVGV
jgi:hypothetical protein